MASVENHWSSAEIRQCCRPNAIEAGGHQGRQHYGLIVRYYNLRYYTVLVKILTLVTVSLYDII
jgi:hypothetical protein